MEPKHSTPFLTHLANWRLLVVAGAVWLSLMGLLFFWTGRFSLAAVVDACGREAPDVLFAPTPARTESFLSGCGAQGLPAYRDLQLVDLVYPAASAAFLVVVLALLVRGLPARLAWLAALPVGASLADYLENVAAWALIVAGSPTATWAADTLQVGSAAKFVLTWASWLAVATLLIARVPMIRNRITAASKPTLRRTSMSPQGSRASRGDVRNDSGDVTVDQDAITIHR